MRLDRPIGTSLGISILSFLAVAVAYMTITMAKNVMAIPLERAEGAENMEASVFNQSLAN